MLRAPANDHPDYFFWNPERMKRSSLICQFGDWLRLVFDRAGVKHGQQEMLSHRLRHSFAVELLLAGVPIEQVGKLLGHKTVRTTERYYSAWVKERQRETRDRGETGVDKDGITGLLAATRRPGVRDLEPSGRRHRRDGPLAAQISRSAR